MYASCQSRAGGLAYKIAKAVLQDKKDPEPKYANIQVWKKETDNMDPRIRFWEVIDRKKAHNILEVEKSLKKKVRY
uniref:Ribosomal protein L33 n=1 Tax=Romanomermis culicivorax TaxID=13658 RepID=A0A915L2C1_ROMCU